MIEKDGVLFHLEPRGDRFEGDELGFDGWVAAYEPIKAVWLLALGSDHLATCARPDVERVFPQRVALGFSGKSQARFIKNDHLGFAVAVESAPVEIDYPVAPAFPRRPMQQRIVSSLSLTFLRMQRQLTKSPEKRWGLTLREHLLARRNRSGAFQRQHVEALLADFATVLPEAHFLQIGANDGLTGDPLYPLTTQKGNRWRGVLVEPVEHLFAELTKRYGYNPLLRLEQAAVGEHDGSTTIYRLNTRPRDPLWLQQLSSLDPTLLQRTVEQLPHSSVDIVAEEVRCLRVQTLLERHQIGKVDLLVIDTEGWDWRILRQFDLDALQPKLILFEHQHLSQDTREEAHRFLSKSSYDWAETAEGDTLAWSGM